MRSAFQTGAYRERDLDQMVALFTERAAACHRSPNSVNALQISGQAFLHCFTAVLAFSSLFAIRDELRPRGTDAQGEEVMPSLFIT